MELVRSDSPEVVHSIASAEALVCWVWSVPALACIASVLGLLISSAISLFVSVHTSVWVGIPVLLALNVFLLWRGRSPRLNWVLAGHADRIYVRRFKWRGKEKDNLNEPDVIILESSEIASLSASIVEALLDGPKPVTVERLVIEPTRSVAEGFSADSFSSPFCAWPLDSYRQTFVNSEEGNLILKWKFCRPALQIFLDQIARECPSILLGHEERSELDLNGVWRGISRNLRNDLSAPDRQKLARATRLGLGYQCIGLLRHYKRISYQKAAAYLAEFEREEAVTRHSAV